jgi:cell division septation protein DedD
MRWVTIICFSAALGWTTLSFMAYRDWDLAFQSSLVACLIFAVPWVALRLNFAGIRRRGHPFEKAKTHKKTHNRSRLAIAGKVLAASLGIFVLAVLTGQWLQKSNKSNKERSSTALRSAKEPSSRPQRLQPSAKDEAKGKAAAEEIAQKTEGLWSVQVGAFRSEKDAVKVATTLRHRGYEAYVIHAELNAADLFRAKVGRFRTREEAERLLVTLKDKEAYTTAFVARM